MVCSCLRLITSPSMATEGTFPTLHTDTRDWLMTPIHECTWRSFFDKGVRNLMFFIVISIHAIHTIIPKINAFWNLRTQGKGGSTWKGPKASPPSCIWNKYNWLGSEPLNEKYLRTRMCCEIADSNSVSFRIRCCGLVADVKNFRNLYNRGQTKLGGLLTPLRVASWTIFTESQSSSSGGFRRH